MPVPRWRVTAALVSTLTFGPCAAARATPVDPFVQVEVNGVVHRVVAFPDTAFCSALDCVAGVIDLQDGAAMVRVVGVMSQGVDPLAPQYGHNHGAWTVRMYVTATNLSADPLTVVAWASTPISPLFLFPSSSQMVPTDAALYQSTLSRLLTPGGPDADSIRLDPVFPDLDGDGDAEIFTALASRSLGGPFQSLGVDLGTAAAGAGFTTVYGGPRYEEHIDPDWMVMSAAMAFTLSGGTDAVSLRGNVNIVPVGVPEPATLGLVGVALVAALRRRHRYSGAHRPDASAAVHSHNAVG
jgi:hypothetical protein